MNARRRIFVTVVSLVATVSVIDAMGGGFQTGKSRF
jgi:hypothetical protein